ncbi:hypothetical protein OUZ56_029810 [Daphnia magna]|uniref:Uncharacterized protein n=1 Tax=Daphnia magna TaxID=35525 RepID=A0ABR0B7W9_9CRUS|nr:hypothetical protein OUZ56_029810 [Daphnia magna]
MKTDVYVFDPLFENETTNPDTFFRCLTGSNKFRFCGGKVDAWLTTAAPGYRVSVQKKDKTGCGLTSLKVSSVIRVGIANEGITCTKTKTMIWSALELRCPDSCINVVQDQQAVIWDGIDPCGSVSGFFECIPVGKRRVFG